MAELSRREFLSAAAACGAVLAVGGVPGRLEAARLAALPARRATVVRAPWARIDRVADGVWAVVSDMSGDRTTYCNGAIVRGQGRTLVLEAYATAQGAAWVAEQAQLLTGRWPDDGVITHKHFDHVDGAAAYAARGGRPAPRLHATDTTIEAVRKVEVGRSGGPDPVKLGVLDAHVPIDPARPTKLDLGRGGPKCTIIPLKGHTLSDVVVELEDPDVIMAGDLVQNGAFPWFGDAVPSAFAPSLRSLRRDRATRYITGHGDPGGPEVLERYIALLELIERTARDAHARGEAAEETAQRFVIPESLAIPKPPPMAVRVAFTAWAKELSGGPAT